MGSSKKCTSCLLPAAVPNANLGSSSTCQFCVDDTQLQSQQSEVRRQQYEADLKIALEQCRGKGEYDCLVNLSGGKDSCLLLHKLKREYGLNVLAYTTDMNVPEVAWANIRRTVDLLDVPHISFRPPTEFYKKMFRHLLANQEARGAVRTVCYVCAPLFEGYSLKLAIEKKIPLVLAGYAPGQPEPDRMEYEFSRSLLCEKDWTPPELVESGLFSETELDLFWNPLKYPADTVFPRYLAPFHAWEYSQEEAMDLVVELGLIKNKKNANPIHSNCPVNWLLMYSDLKHLGFNPYWPEFSKLIREGKASKNYWSIMGRVVDFMIRKKIFLGKNVSKSLTWLGMKESELAITREQQGADYSVQITQNQNLQLVTLRGIDGHAVGPKKNSNSGLKATTVDLFRNNFDQDPHTPAVGTKQKDEWETVTWKEFGVRCLAVAEQITEAGIAKGDRVAIQGPSQAGWSIAECAAYCVGAVVVGVDVNSPWQKTQTILTKVDARVLISVGDNNNTQQTDMPSGLKTIAISNDGLLADCDYSTERNFESSPEIHSTDLATIVFTSGTTGEPKGIAYTHGQVMLAVNEISSEFPLISKGDATISWLPMNHLFQRVMNFVAMKQGAVIHFEDDPRKVAATAREISPKVLCAVPRFLEKLADGLQAEVGKMPWILKGIVRNSMRKDHRKANSWHKFFSRQAAARAREAFGGKLKYIVTGSAALQVEVTETLEFFGFDVLEAYGTSENIVPIAANRPGSSKSGTVGKPFQSNEVRIAADGEIQVRGPGCVKQYWNESDKIVDADGFYSTGDLGHFDEDGFLTITGRKSSQFKTATGRKITPERIESVYRKSDFIEDIVICGEGQRFIVGLIVPSRQFVEACKQSLSAPDVEPSTVQNEAARSLMQKELSKFDDLLEKHERMADFQILPRPFESERNELTPSLKKRRHAIEESFQDDLKDLFKKKSDSTQSVFSGTRL